MRKLARSGPTSDEIVGVFGTFVQIAFHYIVIVHMVHIVLRLLLTTNVIFLYLKNIFGAKFQMLYLEKFEFSRAFLSKKYKRI